MSEFLQNLVYDINGDGVFDTYDITYLQRLQVKFYDYGPQEVIMIVLLALIIFLIGLYIIFKIK